MVEGGKPKLKRRKVVLKFQGEPQGDRVNIGVKIRLDLWRRLRALSLTQGRLTGALLDEAIEGYLKKK